MELTQKQLDDIKSCLKIQKTNGNWDHDTYMLGMYNGMELIACIVEDREPKFKKAPKRWSNETLSRKKI